MATSGGRLEQWLTTTIEESLVGDDKGQLSTTTMTSVATVVAEATSLASTTATPMKGFFFPFSKSKRVLFPFSKPKGIVLESENISF